jgi:hypothetical protein
MCASLFNAMATAPADEWVPLTVTFVEYRKGDVVGKCLAVVSLAPVFILVGFATLVLLKRDLHTVGPFANCDTFAACRSHLQW